MKFQETKLGGVFEVCLNPNADDRGFFARSWCQREFEERGLDAHVRQCNISFNTRRGTLRGMHYQEEPNAETKLVRCTRGSIYDVVVDLRPESTTFRQWVAVILSAEARNMLYVPAGCGHGFLTLEDQAEIFYQMSEFYHPESAKGVRWNDPAFMIEWPDAPTVISERDRTYPDFQ